MTFVILLVGLAAILFVAFRMMPDAPSKFHPSAVSLQALITVIAVVVAGYWYLIERRGTAHANVEISAIGVRLNENAVLVQARVEIENSGQILLEPQEWEVRLLSVVPSRSFPLDAAIQDARDHYDQWPERIAGAPAYFDNELQWSALRRFNGPAEHEIEPGERDIRIFDMLVPCTVATANLTIALRKPRPQWWRPAEPPEGWWWKDRLLIGLSGLCAGEAGVVRALGPEDDGDEAEGEE